MFDEAELRFALSHYSTGITVVTCRDGQKRARAITVNAFTGVSLDPPLILYCLGKSAFNFDAFSTTEAFAVNILSAGQEDLSNRFAREAEDNFADLPVSALATGSPLLSDCLGAFDCRTEAVHDAGDHQIMVGRVVALSVPREAKPLLYFRSAYRSITP